MRIETDWSRSPPAELWRRPIGPGWSSFAVSGNLLFTQEQRGDDEVVSCYDATTGEPLWRHRDPTRFWESNAGAGPRATPSLSGDRVYTLGATGILNALVAGDGSVVWSRNAAADTGAEVPDWGFTNSPLVIGDVVIVYAGGLVAYDLTTAGSYSSPHLLILDGVVQIVVLSGAGATSVTLAGGTPLWEHSWPSGIVQPALMANGDLPTGVVRERRARAGGGQARSLHRASAIPGHQGQDLESPGVGRRPLASAQRRRDGRLPAGAGGGLGGRLRW